MRNTSAYPLPYADKTPTKLSRKPWLTTKEPQLIMFQGERGCIPLDEYVYTPTGISLVKDVYDGMPILGGYIKEPHVFEDEVYQVEINKTKFIANGEHPIWIKKYGNYKNKPESKPEWKSVREIYEHYNTKTGKETRWYAERYDAKEFKFDTISIGLKFAKLMGYLMSDGYFSSSQSVKFTNVNQSLLQDVVGISMELSEEYDITLKEYSKGNGKDIMLTSSKNNPYNNLLKNKLRELNVIDRTTLGKLTSLQEDELIEFVKGYFNGDGNLYVNKRVVITFFTGIHKQQAYELQYILWRLGIKSFISFRKRKDFHKGCWDVEIGQIDSVKRLISILDDRKYPDKFKKAAEVLQKLKPNQTHQKSEQGEWVPIFNVKKIGRTQVCGWETKDSNEIISYNGLKTHNSGKGVAVDHTWIKFYKQWFTIVYLFAADSLENLFVAVNLNCKQVWDKWREENAKLPLDEQLPEPLHCNCDRAIPIFWVIPDYVEIDQYTLDRYNGCYFKDFEEYSNAYKDRFVDDFIENLPWVDWTKIRKPKKLIPRPLIVPRRITIPTTTARIHKFKEEFTEIVLDARKDHRVVVMNPATFATPKDTFSTVAIALDLFKNSLMMKHYRNLDEKEVAQMRGVTEPVPISQWTKQEKNWHKLVLVINEVRSLAPSVRLSGDKESTETKRKLFNLIPIMRHLRIWGIIDYQQPEDLFVGVRNLANVVVLKRGSDLIFGEDWAWFAEKLEYDRENIIQYRYGGMRSKDVMDELRKTKPLVSELPIDYGYIVYSRDKSYKLKKFYMPPFHHKGSLESFEKITGIEWSIPDDRKSDNDDSVTPSKSKTSASSTKDDEHDTAMKLIDSLRQTDHKKYKDCLKTLQEKEIDLQWKTTNFKNMSVDTLTTTYLRWKKAADKKAMQNLKK